MKTIEVKKGSKTSIKIVPDDYEPESESWVNSDLTTSPRHSIGFGDIPKEKWGSIFGDKNHGKTKQDN